MKMAIIISGSIFLFALILWFIFGKKSGVTSYCDGSNTCKIGNDSNFTTIQNGNCNGGCYWNYYINQNEDGKIKSGCVRKKYETTTINGKRYDNYTSKAICQEKLQEQLDRLIFDN